MRGLIHRNYSQQQQQKQNILNSLQKQQQQHQPNASLQRYEPSEISLNHSLHHNDPFQSTQSLQQQQELQQQHQSTSSYMSPTKSSLLKTPRYLSCGNTFDVLRANSTPQQSPKSQTSSPYNVNSNLRRSSHVQIQQSLNIYSDGYYGVNEYSPSTNLRTIKQQQQQLQQYALRSSSVQSNSNNNNNINDEESTDLEETRKRRDSLLIKSYFQSDSTHHHTKNPDASLFNSGFTFRSSIRSIDAVSEDRSSNNNNNNMNPKKNQTPLRNLRRRLEPLLVAASTTAPINSNLKSIPISSLAPSGIRSMSLKENTQLLNNKLKNNNSMNERSAAISEEYEGDVFADVSSILPVITEELDLEYQQQQQQQQQSALYQSFHQNSYVHNQTNQNKSNNIYSSNEFENEADFFLSGSYHPNSLFSLSTLSTSQMIPNSNSAYLAGPAHSQKFPKDYKKLTLIGRGGFSKVFSCMRESDGAIFSCKQIDFNSHTQARLTYERELAFYSYFMEPGSRSSNSSNTSNLNSSTSNSINNPAASPELLENSHSILINSSMNPRLKPHFKNASGSEFLPQFEHHEIYTKPSTATGTTGTFSASNTSFIFSSSSTASRSPHITSSLHPQTVAVSIGTTSFPHRSISTSTSTTIASTHIPKTQLTNSTGFLIYLKRAKSLRKSLFDVRRDTQRNESMYKVTCQPLHAHLAQSTPNLLRFVAQFASYLDFIHSYGWTHGDIRLDNIIINTPSTSVIPPYTLSTHAYKEQVQLSNSDFLNGFTVIDYGSSFQRSKPYQILTSQITPEYMPPEFVMHLIHKTYSAEIIATLEFLPFMMPSCITYSMADHAFDPNPEAKSALDIWQLGCMLIELLTGVPVWVKEKCETVVEVDGKQVKETRKVYAKGIFATKERRLLEIYARQIRFIRMYSKMAKDLQLNELHPILKSILDGCFTPNPAQRITPKQIITLISSAGFYHQRS